jgi:U3 small nucleolar RNA-associated protein 20
LKCGLFKKCGLSKEDLEVWLKCGLSKEDLEVWLKCGLSKKDVEVLLTYVEEDLYDPMRQSTAFPLLKAILSHTLLVPMIYQVMKKVEELSVQSESSTVKLNCRQCVLQYLLKYPSKKKLQTHLHLFIQYLDYDTEDGRQSVLELLVALFTRFPRVTIK